MNFTASDPHTAPLDNESHPALPCVYPPQTDDDDDDSWLLFVLLGECDADDDDVRIVRRLRIATKAADVL